MKKVLLLVLFIVFAIYTTKNNQATQKPTRDIIVIYVDCSNTSDFLTLECKECFVFKDRPKLLEM